ncbi:hypothetical protein Hanom_Chr14g01292641 [Helianthus anomalus]
MRIVQLLEHMRLPLCLLLHPSYGCVCKRVRDRQRERERERERLKLVWTISSITF